MAEEVAEEVAEEEAAPAPKGTPNINSFATMKVKFVGDQFYAGRSVRPETTGFTNNYYLITLSKAVDRLFVNWPDGLEELAVDENLEATSIAWNHKYMPGTTQYYATWSQNGGSITMGETINCPDLETSEYTYNFIGVVADNSLYNDSNYCDSSLDGVWAPVLRVTEYGPYRYFVPSEYMTDGEFDPAKWDALIAAYIAQYPQYASYDIERPTICNYDAEDIEDLPSIQGVRVFNRINTSFQTVIATPSQTAFITVQNGFAVYYNRAGKIVGIEPYEEGMFD